ncbi:hypothetical protein chiPu_0011173 [Chiloscyllium punctatum]|uniref:Uncharacterized protein n=1 Tax=Chiloscyllium punctatum TaxID=137246 RepID=A0A401SQM5_CHIPU|nr:hypothetical protein [Chiloscyllium punctatum]
MFGTVKPLHVILLPWEQEQKGRVLSLWSELYHPSCSVESNSLKYELADSCRICMIVQISLEVSANLALGHTLGRGEAQELVGVPVCTGPTDTVRNL